MDASFVVKATESFMPLRNGTIEAILMQILSRSAIEAFITEGDNPDNIRCYIQIVVSDGVVIR